jgi:hypothetical protein
LNGNTTVNDPFSESFSFSLTTRFPGVILCTIYRERSLLMNTCTVRKSYVRDMIMRMDYTHDSDRVYSFMTRREE